MRKDNRDDVIRKKNRSKYVVIIAIVFSLLAAGCAYMAINRYLKFADVVVATKNIEEFTKVDESFFTYEKVPLQFAGSFETDISKYNGYVSKISINKGTPVNKDMFTLEKAEGGTLPAKINKDMKAFCVPVTAQTAVGGLINVNDRINIIIINANSNSQKITLENEKLYDYVTIENVRVLGTLGEGDKLRGIIAELKEKDIQRLSNADKIKISLNPM